MKTIIYQQADSLHKQPQIMLQFPTVLPDSDAQNIEYEKRVEEIRIILCHALMEQLKREDNI